MANLAAEVWQKVTDCCSFLDNTACDLRDEVKAIEKRLEVLGNETDVIAAQGNKSRSFCLVLFMHLSIYYLMN